MDDPKSNNSFRKTHTPSSDNCEAKEGHSKGWLTVQKASSKLNTHQWREVIRSFIPLCILIFYGYYCILCLHLVSESMFLPLS